MDLRRQDRAAPAARRFYPTAEGILGRGQPDPARDATRPRVVQTHGGVDRRGIRPTPQDAARLSPGAWWRGAARPRRHRPGPARRDAFSPGVRPPGSPDL